MASIFASSWQTRHVSAPLRLYCSAVGAGGAASGAAGGAVVCGSVGGGVSCAARTTAANAMYTPTSATRRARLVTALPPPAPGTRSDQLREALSRRRYGLDRGTAGRFRVVRP